MLLGVREVSFKRQVLKTNDHSLPSVRSKVFAWLNRVGMFEVRAEWFGTKKDATMAKEKPLNVALSSLLNKF